jgi:hypothetical protein
MVKTDRLCISIALLALLAVGAAPADATVSDDMGSVGIISSVNGEARVTRSADPRQANQPTFRGPIIYGDRFSTSKDSTVGLLVGQNSLLTLQELSDVRIAEAGRNRQVLEMVRGRVCLAVGQPRLSGTEPLRLKTATAMVTATPGTLLHVEVTPAPTESRLPDGGSGEQIFRISTSTQVADRVGAPVVETYQVIEGSIDIVSLASSTSRISLRSGQNIRIAGGVIGQPFGGSQVNCRVQNTQIIPPHTVTPKAAQQAIVEELRQNATAGPVAAMSQSSGGHGSSTTIPGGVILPITNTPASSISGSTTHTTISVVLP